MKDWQPLQYLKYKDERTQPTIDLVNRIPLHAPKRIIDIGCGPGNSTAVLHAKWSDAEIIGIDNSPSMLTEAKKSLPFVRFLQRDVKDELSSLGCFDVVFSNAALQWMPQHETLLPKLFAMLNQGGVLAVQVPYVRELPIYACIMGIIAKKHWQPYFLMPPVFPRHFPYAHYYEIISSFSTAIELWETDYIHILPSHAALVEWYKGSGLRPFLNMLPDNSLQEAFLVEYASEIKKAYPIEKDGSVLLPFKRIFFMAFRS